MDSLPLPLRTRTMTIELYISQLKKNPQKIRELTLIREEYIKIASHVLDVLPYINYISDVKTHMEFILSIIKQRLSRNISITNSIRDIVNVESINILLLNNDDFIRDLKIMSFTLNREVGFNREDLLMMVIQQDGWVLRFAGVQVQANKKFVMAAVRQDGSALQFADDALKSDEEVVMAAIRQDESSFKFASRELKDNKKFVMAIVKQDGMALRFVSDELKSDEEVVMAAIRQNGSSFQFASRELKEKQYK